MGDEPWNVPAGVLAMLAGTVGIYGVLFATGMFLYGNVGAGLGFSALALGGIFGVRALWPRVRGAVS
jgi:hypothetical protein